MSSSIVPSALTPTLILNYSSVIISTAESVSYHIPLVRGRQGQLTLTCPSCRQVSPIPFNGVKGLQSAFQIDDFIGISDDLKKVKDLIPNQEPGVEGDATSQTLSKKTTHYYCEHADI